MPLETGNYISDLVPANPIHADPLNQGDGHVRLIKSALKATFPNFTSGALNSTQAQIDGLVTGTTPSHGQFRGSGLLPPGIYMDFGYVPARFTNGGVAAGGQSAVDWIEADGSVYNIADFPDLGPLFGATYGGNGTTTFGVPRLTDTGRFRRSRTASVPLSTYQADQNLIHTHIGSVDPGGIDHQHDFFATSTGQSADHTHGYTGASSSGVPRLGGGGGGVFDTSNSWTTGTTSNDHTHNVSGTTGYTKGSAYLHQHTFETAPIGGSEARPQNISVVVCIKT